MLHEEAESRTADMMNIVRKAGIITSVAALVGASALGITGQASAMHSVVTVKADFGASYTVKPKAINPGAADGGVLYSDIKWTTWGTGHARGIATEKVKTCKPNCATGPVNSKRVVLYLDGVKAGHFTKSISSSGIVRDLVK